eukprot:3452668-Amphidinium_carterae.1
MPCETPNLPNPQTPNTIKRATKGGQVGKKWFHGGYIGAKLVLLPTSIVLVLGGLGVSYAIGIVLPDMVTLAGVLWLVKGNCSGGGSGSRDQVWCTPQSFL